MATLAKAKHNAKDVIATAKRWVLDTYADESIADVGLEEVVLNGKRWNITIGFKRSRTHPKKTSRDLIYLLGGSPDQTSFESALKVVEISDETGEVIAMRDRLTD